MRRLSRIIGVTALVLVATAGPAMAAGNQPYHTLVIEESVLALDNGQLFGTPEELECPTWAEWRFFSRGTDQMHHLGRFEFDLTQCSRYLEPPFVGASEGTTTLIAANGDELVLAHELTFDVYFTTFPVPDGFAGDGTWTVVDGSGRFATATGSGTMTTTGDVPTDDTPWSDLPAGGTLWTFSGEIEYRASDRSGR